MSEGKGNVVNGLFPKTKITNLYDKLWDEIFKEENDDITCVEIIGIVELLKRNYIDFSFPKSE